MAGDKLLLNNHLLGRRDIIFDKLPETLTRQQVLRFFYEIKYADDRDVVVVSFLDNLVKNRLVLPYRNVGRNGIFYTHEMLIKLLWVAEMLIEQRKFSGPKGAIDYGSMNRILTNTSEVMSNRDRLKARIEAIINSNSFNFLAPINEEEYVEERTYCQHPLYLRLDSTRVALN
ncbi:MAG: hypothetical protein ABI721_01470 [Candidatus Dojkabacteria bacterium]